MGLRPSLKADLALLGVSFIWGSTFVVIKQALDDASPFAFLLIRFLLAGVALGLIFRRDLWPVRRSETLAGAGLGLLLCAGFGFQTVGLLHTTPSRSAFLTGVYVVIVPLLGAALRLRGLAPSSLAGVGLAFAGLWLLTGGGAGGGLGRGEILTLCCSVAFAAHIVGVDIATRRHPARRVAFWQIAAAGIFCLPLAAFAETPRFVPTPALLASLLVVSLLGTALAFAVQNAVQAKTTPTRAAIVFASEPVFAALTSFVVEGERLGAAATAGAALILAGMVVSEIPAARSGGAGT